MTSKIINKRNIYHTQGALTALTIVSVKERTVYLLDTAILPLVRPHCWRKGMTYPETTISETGVEVSLPRLLLNVSPKLKVKTLNGNLLDLRLANLRIGARPPRPPATLPIKTRENELGHGVTLHPNRKHRKYQAWTPGKQRRSLGYYPTATDAGDARQEWIEKNNWKPEKNGRPFGWRKKGN